jgi:hypothetical protein
MTVRTMNNSRFSLSTMSCALGVTTLMSLGSVAATSAAEVEAPVVVRDTQVAASSKTGLRIMKGTLELPRRGSWGFESIYEELGGVTEVYLDREMDEEADYEGERMAKLQNRRAIRERRRELSQMFYQCSRFARNGDGLGPKTQAQLIPSENANGWKPDPGVHLMPGVRMFKVENGDKRRIDSKEVLLIDTTPAIGDGKHWILDCRGVAKREAIDPEQVKALGLKISPQRPPHGEETTKTKVTAPYQVYARLSGDPGLVTLTVRDSHTKKTMEVQWDTRKASAGA